MRSVFKRNQQAAPLDWQICESDAGWQSARQTGTDGDAWDSRAKQSRARRRSRSIAFLLVGVLLLGTVGLLWYWGQKGLNAVEQELQAAMATETWRVDNPIKTEGAKSHQAKSLGLTLAEFDEAATDLQVVNLGQEWAVVQVIVQPTAGITHGITSGALAYRQVRVYARTAQSWVRVPPTAKHWGGQRQLESRYFRFHYFAQDATAVEVAAARADDLYLAFYASFFPEPPPSEKLVIQVDPTVTPGKLAQTVGVAAPIALPSPAATLAPIDIAEGDLLVQSLALAMLPRLMEQAMTDYDLSYHLRPLISGIRLWLIWDQELPLAVWQEPVVGWILWDQRIASMTDNPFVPHFARDLCIHHRLWMELPIEVDVHVSCWEDGENERFLAWRYPYPPTPKPAFPLWYKPLSMAYIAHEPAPIHAEESALATVVEYAAATYGKDRLPVLLAALPEYDSWGALIPAVFGLSLAEFEAGWHAFIDERYALVCCATLNVR